MSTSDEIDRVVAFATLGDWEATFKEALERYCEYCRSVPLRDLARRPKVLLDFDLWADPVAAMHGHPIGGLGVESAAHVIAERVKRRQADPYAILGTLARERGA